MKFSNQVCALQFWRHPRSWTSQCVLTLTTQQWGISIPSTLLERSNISDTMRRVCPPCQTPYLLQPRVLRKQAPRKCAPGLFLIRCFSTTLGGLVSRTRVTCTTGIISGTWVCCCTWIAWCRRTRRSRTRIEGSARIAHTTWVRNTTRSSATW